MWQVLKHDLGEFISTVKADTSETVAKVVTTTADTGEAATVATEDPVGAGSSTNATLRALRADVQTYEEPVPEAEQQQFETFLRGFDVAANTTEISQLLQEPVVANIHAQLVPVVVPYEVFWQRYFYRAERLKPGHGRQQLALDLEAEEDELGWGDEQEEWGEVPPDEPPAAPTPTPSSTPAAPTSAPTAAPAAAVPLAAATPTTTSTVAPSPAGAVSAQEDALRVELQALRREHEAAEQQHATAVADLTVQLATSQQTCAAAEEQLQQMTQMLAEAQTQATDVQAQLDQARAEAQRLREAEQALAQTVERHAGEGGQVQAALADLRLRVTTAEAERDEARQQLLQHQHTAQAKYEELTAAAAADKRALGEAAEQAKAANQATEQARSAREAVAADLDGAREALAAAQRSQAATKGDLDLATGRVVDLEAEIVTLRRELLAAADKPATAGPGTDAPTTAAAGAPPTAPTPSPTPADEAPARPNLAALSTAEESDGEWEDWS